MNQIIRINLKKSFSFFLGGCFLSVTAQSVTTLAGSSQGFTDGTGTTAQFSNPIGLAVDNNGNIFVADEVNNRIRKITAAGMVSTFAGSTFGFANGIGTLAQFEVPMGVAVDAGGNVFVADMYNHLIRKITAAGLVTTFAGSTPGSANGTGSAAQFNYPVGVAVDPSGNVFVSDTYNHRIRKITPAGVVTTIAGSIAGFANGTGTAAKFDHPSGLAIDAAGNLFVADGFNNQIRKVTPSGVVTTLAGGFQGYIDGSGTSARFYGPFGVAIDAAGNILVTDEMNHSIRKITATGVVTTLAGSTIGFADGIGTAAQFNGPAGIAVDAAGNIFVADDYNHRIRKIMTHLETTDYLLENQVTIYPNPTSSLINIELEDSTQVKVTIFDMNGRTLLSKNSIDNIITVEMNNFTNGIYLLQIITDKGKVYKKIWKQ